MAKRIAALDGLRGMAAALVVAHHISWVMFNSPRFVGHGYLSVDFFFLLSGFVVAAAYERRLASILKFQAYAILRLRRLYPLIAIGIIAGYLAHQFAASPLGDQEMRLLSQLIFLPTLWLAGDIFALNPVQWSLFVEFVANGLHVALLRWATTFRLFGVVTVLAVAEFAVAYEFSSLALGWSAHNFYGGLIRGGFGFFAGVLCFRLHDTSRLPAIRVPWPALVVALPLLIVVASIYRLTLLWYVDPLIVVFAMPVLLVLGINARINGKVATIAMVAGELSYPVYTIQEPILVVVRHATRQPGATLGPYIICGIAVGAVLLASVALLFIDRWLQSKLSPRSHVYPL